MKDEIVLILDRSGSMSKIIDDAIGGVNNFLKEHRELDAETDVTVALFDHEYKMIYDAIDINDVSDFDRTTYSPRGTTALLDAIGRTITTIAERRNEQDETERARKVIVVINTDGYENASVEYTKTQISDMITDKRDNDNWEFIFLAANEDAFKTGMSYGIKGQNTMAYDYSGHGTVSSYNCATRMSRNMRTE